MYYGRNEMNRFIIYSGAVGLVLATLQTPAFSQSKQYSMAVGSLGGTMGRLGAGLIETYNKAQEAAKMNVTPGAGRANPVRLSQGGADFAFSFSNFAKSAIAGNVPYKAKHGNIRAVARFYDSCYHQYASKELYDKGIRSWDDIVKSKSPLKVGVSKKGTSTEYTGQLIVKHLGTTYKDLTGRGYKLTFAGTNGNSQAISSGQIDFYMHNSGDPSSAGVKAAISRDLVFLEMTDNVKSMLAGHGYSPCTIPGGIYKGSDKDTASMGLSGVLLTTDKMSADDVYNLLKATHEGIKFLGGVHKIFKSWTPKYGSDTKGVPLHAGAERFYKEQGIL